MRRILWILPFLLAVTVAPIAQADIGLLDWDGWQNDRMYKTLLRIFGQVLDSTAPASAFEVVVKDYIGYVTNGAAAYLGFIITVALVHSAKDDTPFGKNMSGTWGSLRILLSFGLMVPMGVSGFPGSVHVIMEGAKFATYMANGVNNTGIDQIGEYIKPISAPTGGESALFTADLMQVQVCMQTYNEIHTNRGWSGSGMTFDTVAATTDFIHFRSTATSRAPAGMCGEMVIDFKDLVRDNEGEASLTAVRQVHLEAVTQLMKDIEAPAKSIAIRALKVNAENKEDLAPLSDEEARKLSLTILAYDRALMGTTIYFKDEFGDKMRAEFVAEAKEVGWSGVNRFWMTISRLNGRALSLVRYRPAIKEPDWVRMDNRFIGVRDFMTVMNRAKAMSTEYFFSKVESDSFVKPRQVTGPALLDWLTNINQLTQRVADWLVGMNLRDDLADNYDDISFSTVRAGVEGFKPSERVTVTPQDEFIDASLGRGTVDPISRIADLGHRFIGASETLWFSLVMADAAVSGADGVAQGVANSVFGLFGAGAPTLAASKSIQSLVQSAKKTLDPVIKALMIVGVYYAFVVPFQVWLHYLLGVFGWIKLVVEAVIAAPLWMIVHLSFKGDDFIDHRMIPGWMILLAIVMKPVLMVIGFYASILLFVTFVIFIDADFSRFFAEVTATSNNGLVTFITQLVLQMLAYFSVIKVVVRVMTTLPDDLLSRWMGGPSMRESEEHDVAGVVAMTSQARSLQDSTALRQKGYVSGGPSGTGARNAP